MSGYFSRTGTIFTVPKTFVSEPEIRVRKPYETVVPLNGFVRLYIQSVDILPLDDVECRTTF